MVLTTKRLILRSWQESDAKSLYQYAKDPEVGPCAGWPPHQSLEESLNTIKAVFNKPECYAVCLKEDNVAIGSIQLKLKGSTDMTARNDECELGYWIGKPFWNHGYISEAIQELLRHAFEDLAMNTIWCGYYEGNSKSAHVQAKAGFIYHHSCDDVPVPLMNEVRVGHTNFLTKEHWTTLNNQK